MLTIPIHNKIALPTKLLIPVELKNFNCKFFYDLQEFQNEKFPHTENWNYSNRTSNNKEEEWDENLLKIESKLLHRLHKLP